MYKNYRYINAGTTEIHRYGRKAVAKVKACMIENNGFVSIPVDGGKYWTIGTSEGKYGEFMKYEDTFFSVNSAGFAWAKVGTEKAEKLIEFMNAMIEEMNRINNERCSDIEEDEEDEEIEEIEESEYEMKADETTKIYKSAFGIKENHENINKYVKAVIINFGDDRGDIIVKNDNFGTRRKYADFTNGKKEAGLNPLQIVFSGIDVESKLHTRYINQDDIICEF